ncbi:MAG: type I-B CRISPR-associated protein Cas8b1/Cst1 [Caldilinea sp.]|jgi:CRISPR-associated protein Cst1|nr:type I-B CRISPR-associated protein Cas8b1/Cst1 [Caldilinea sp.]
MLSFSRHLYYDVGVATITAFAGKEHPNEVTEVDLQKIADYIQKQYLQQPLRSFLTVVFPNSGFTQPAFFNQPEKQADYARRVLQSYGLNVPVSDEQCIFTLKPAVAVAFDVYDKLPAGRAFRQHIPLLTGEGTINFFPGGDAGLPISGLAMLAIQVFPLGCAKVSGRLLAVHSDNEELILHFARTFLAQNRKYVQLAQESGSTKMPESQYSQRTLLISTLLEASELQLDALNAEQNFSLTAYHLSNSGQGVDLDIYYLPLQVVGFLREMRLAKYRAHWSAIVQRAWEVAPAKKGGKQKTEDFQPKRNWLYEDIFALPDNSRTFLRTYFLRKALRYARQPPSDPRSGYSLSNETHLVSWDITARFLKGIMNMEKERIEQIRKLGDQLADYVSSENDRRFFHGFFTERRYDRFRNLLIKANVAHVKRGKPPFITLDPYIVVFEEGDEVARNEWALARDLVLIRMIERLYDQGWLRQNADTLTVDDEQSEVDA